MASPSKIILAQLIVGSLLCAFAVSTTAGEVFHGKWELNIAKSKFDPGPPPKSQTRTMSPQGDMETTVIETVNAKGEKTSSHSSYRLDGKDYPVTGNVEIDSIAFMKVDSNTSRGWLKRGGKTMAEVVRTVSADGKTLTLTNKGTSPQGQAINNVLVFDRK